MMMITATILATGPSMLSRIDWSGASQGIDEPPAWAGTAAIIATTIAVEVSMARRAPCRAARIMSFLLLVGAGQGDMRRWRDRALRPAPVRTGAGRSRRGRGRQQGRWFRQAERAADRSEEHTSELQSLMRISYAVFCLKKKIRSTHIATR